MSLVSLDRSARKPGWVCPRVLARLGWRSLTISSKHQLNPRSCPKVATLKSDLMTPTCISVRVIQFPPGKKKKPKTQTRLGGGGRETVLWSQSNEHRRRIEEGQANREGHSTHLRKLQRLCSYALVCSSRPPHPPPKWQHQHSCSLPTLPQCLSVARQPPPPLPAAHPPRTAFIIVLAGFANYSEALLEPRLPLPTHLACILLAWSWGKI